MIKQAEIQNAYLLGRQAAMEKLAEYKSIPMSSEPPIMASMPPEPEPEPEPPILASMPPEPEPGPPSSDQHPVNSHDKDIEATPGLPDLSSELMRQKAISQLIGLGSTGLTRARMMSDPLIANKPNYIPHSALNPMNLATMQNLSRAGMLGGAIGGTALGGSPLAALTSTAGALGGGMLGGNLGRALGAGIAAYKNEGGGLMNARTQNLVAGGGALGGLAGGLGAGYLT